MGQWKGGYFGSASKKLLVRLKEAVSEKCRTKIKESACQPLMFVKLWIYIYIHNLIIYTVYTYTYIHTCCAYISPHSSTAVVWVGPNIRIRIKCWRPWMMPSGGSRVHSKRFCTSCCEIFPLYKYLPWLEENHHSNGTQMVDFSLLSTAFRRVCVLGSISWQCCYQVRSAWHCGAWRGQSPKCWVFAKIITGNSGTNQHWRAK